MTANELATQFNNTYGLGSWPDRFEVDGETYANCCQEIFSYLQNRMLIHTNVHLDLIKVSIGPNAGLMFKGVELILVGNK